MMLDFCYNMECLLYRHVFVQTYTYLFDENKGDHYQPDHSKNPHQQILC